MKQTKINFSIFMLTVAILLFSCNDQATVAEKNDTDTTTTVAKIETPEMPAYDAAMDPYIVGGDGVQKLKDTLGVKMYIAILKPGDSAMLHTHPDHSVYVLEGGELAVSFKGMDRMVMTLRTGDALINGPLSDAAKNIGKTTIRLLCHDIYRPRAK